MAMRARKFGHLPDASVLTEKWNENNYFNTLHLAQIHTAFRSTMESLKAV